MKETNVGIGINNDIGWKMLNIDYLKRCKDLKKTIDNFKGDNNRFSVLIERQETLKVCGKHFLKVFESIDRFYGSEDKLIDLHNRLEKEIKSIKKGLEVLE